MPKTKKSGPRAQIRYWTTHSPVHAEGGYNPDLHTTSLLIINEKSRILSILEKFYGQAEPIAEKRSRTKGKAVDRLSYELFTIVSHGKNPEELDWTKIFNGKLTRDRELRERAKIDRLEIYVDEHIQQLAS